MPNHKILVQPSGREFTAAEDLSVLAAALQAGITLPYGCRTGSCGSCKGRVRSGRVRHDAHAAAALSAAELAQGQALFCCAHAESDLIIEARVSDALDGVLPRRMPARVERIDRPAADVAMLWLKLPAGERLQFRAGQYADFLLANGVRRSYSIASVPGTEGPVEFHVRHLPGGVFTDALFGAAAPAIQERSIVRIEAPLGTFYLREQSSEPIVLLASGTGFAPIKAIAETIFERRLNRDEPAAGRRARPVILYWGARTRADLYLDALPRRWEREQPNFRYVPVLSDEPGVGAHAGDGPAAARMTCWEGRTGFVHEAVMQDLPDLSGHQVYACGAPAMVHAAQRDFVERCGLREQNFFSDAFVSRADLAQA
jgi:CDP-4-dehydro-6-deoxyglucose reductase